MLQLLRPAGRKLPPKKGTDLSRLGVQHLGQHLRVVSLPSQSRLQVVDVLRQNACYDLDRQRLLGDPVAFLE